MTLIEKAAYAGKYSARVSGNAKASELYTTLTNLKAGESYKVTVFATASLLFTTTFGVFFAPAVFGGVLGLVFTSFSLKANHLQLFYRPSFFSIIHFFVASSYKIIYCFISFGIKF